MVKVIYSPKHKEWIELPKYSKEGIYQDGRLWITYRDAKKVMKKKDLDLVTAVTGYPGYGKSTFVIQEASICDHTFNHKRMYQNVEDFIEGVKNSKNYGEAHCLDESYDGMNSGEIRREVGRALMNVMNIIRQKRLYIFIVLPNFFDLHKSIAIFRTRWLFHLYSPEFGDIGYFAAFGRSAKQRLYIKGKKFEDYDCVPAEFIGKFTPEIPSNFDWKAYEKIKEHNLKNVFIKSHEDRSAVQQRNTLLHYLKTKLSHTSKKLSELTGLSERSVQDGIRKINKQNLHNEDEE